MDELNNAKFVLSTKSFDRTTQKIESVDPYVEGDYVYNVRIVELSESREVTNRANTCFKRTINIKKK